MGCELDFSLYKLLMTPTLQINWSEEGLQWFQQAKDFWQEKLTSATNSAQQIGESWKKTATQVTEWAINAINSNFGQAKNSLEQTLQAAEQIPSSTSSAIQTAISSSISDWLTEHSPIWRLLQILGWAINHPIISLIILLFALAILGSIIKAIVRLIETASWSILQVPFRLILVVLKFVFLSFAKIGSFVFQKITAQKITNQLAALPPASAELIPADKQERLAIIAARLAQIHKEQQELLKEAAELLAAEILDSTKVQK